MSPSSSNRLHNVAYLQYKSFADDTTPWYLFKAIFSILVHWIWHLTNSFITSSSLQLIQSGLWNSQRKVMFGLCDGQELMECFFLFLQIIKIILNLVNVIICHPFQKIYQEKWNMEKWRNSTVPALFLFYKTIWSHRGTTLSDKSVHIQAHQQKLWQSCRTDRKWCPLLPAPNSNNNQLFIAMQKYICFFLI